MSDQNDIDGMALAKEQRMDDHPDNWWFKPPGDTRPTPETDRVASYEGNWDTKALRMTNFARRLERERDAAYRTIQYLQKKHGT